MSGRRTWGLARARRALCALALGLALLPAAQAHLMVAQRGTLNLVGDGGFMVLSLPVTALSGVDDDADGRLSPAELDAHTAGIEAQVQRGVQLLDGDAALPLQGVLLQLSPDDHAVGSARQLVVLGRFALGAQRTGLRLRMTLFGTGDGERAQEVTVSQGDRVQRLLLAPGRAEAALLPGAWASFADHWRQGLSHVLGGLDHLLFLAVVLASGWGLRPALWALSSFTLGHGITLAASALGGMTVPPAIVEPAIAATVVGMALYDHGMHKRRQRGETVAPQWVRLALVFGCALIHGLGLAGALGSLGLDASHRLWSLAGFNLGVEAAQIGVALLAAAMLAGLRSRAAMRAVRAAALAPAGALAVAAVGSIWFVQRIVAA